MSNPRARAHVGPSKRRHANADIALLRAVWNYIAEAGRPVSHQEVTRHFGVTRNRMYRLLDSLSIHRLPIYEEGGNEKNCKEVYYAIVRKLSPHKVEELLLLEEDEKSRVQGEHNG